jgi:hypothetical protein
MCVSILPTMSLIDMIYCTADINDAGVGVDFYIHTDSASPQCCEMFS